MPREAPLITSDGILGGNTVPFTTISFTDDANADDWYPSSGLGNATVNRVSGVWSADSTGKLVALRGDRTQYIQYTYEFDNAYWTKFNCSVAATGYSDPDGGTNARLVVEDDTAPGSTHYWQKTAIPTSSRYFALSAYVKANGRNWVQLLLLEGAVAGGSWFNLSDGSTGTASEDNGAAIIDVDSEAVAGYAGWYRIWIIVDMGSIQTSPDFYFRLGLADADPTYDGDGSSGIYIYGAQLEALEGPEAIPGDELVTNGDFAAVTDDAGELSSGLLTVGACYKISARTDGDFISSGSPDNNVGTYFNATDTGVGLLDAGDKVFPVTFDSWTVTTAGWGPEAVAGSLTSKAKVTSGLASTLRQTLLTTGKVYEVTFTISNYIAGGLYIYGFRYEPYASADGTYSYYKVAYDAMIQVQANAAGDFTIDNVSCKEITAPGGYDDGWEPGPAVTCSGATGTVPSNVGITPYGVGHPGGQMINWVLRPRVLNGANWTATNITPAAGTGIDGQSKTIKLTATAANGTLIHSAITTPATNTHCTSAYFKRVTGTGSIYITDNNGTNWTEVTGITSTAWTRAYITRSQAAPQIGFKVATSGDAVLVDCTELINNQAIPSLYWVGIPDGDNTSPVGQTSNANDATVGMRHTMSAAFKAIYQAGGSGTTYVKLKMGFDKAAGDSVSRGVISILDNASSLLYVRTANDIKSFDGINTAILNLPNYAYGDILEICIIHPSSTGKFRIGYSWNGAAWVWGTEATYDGAFTLGTYLQWFYINNYPMWIEKFEVWDEAMSTTWIESYYG